MKLTDLAGIIDHALSMQRPHGEAEGPFIAKMIAQELRLTFDEEDYPAARITELGGRIVADDPSYRELFAEERRQVCARYNAWPELREGLARAREAFSRHDNSAVRTFLCGAEEHMAGVQEGKRQ